jgi:hypothetical protein
MSSLWLARAGRECSFKLTSACALARFGRGAGARQDRSADLQITDRQMQGC